MKFTDVPWLIIFTIFIICSVQSYFSIPDVYWSTSKDKCVKVIFDGTESDCSELPEKYNKVWVE